MADTDREADLRKEYIDAAVKAVVKIEEKWKGLCAVDSSSAWTESYFRETNDDSTNGGTGSPIRGVPQYAPFPFFDVSRDLLRKQQFHLEHLIAPHDAERLPNMLLGIE